MGLFGFGKKKRQSEEAAEAAAEENDKADEAISETAEASAGGIQEPSFRNRPMSTTAVAMSTVRGTSTTRTCPTMTNTSTWAPTICRSSKASNCA